MKKLTVNVKTVETSGKGTLDACAVVKSNGVSKFTARLRIERYVTITALLNKTVIVSCLMKTFVFTKYFIKKKLIYRLLLINIFKKR